ncbi:hypothetical protein C7N83_00935 [Neisseria iguanae]|uniref:Uncharacterized protein n=1 Tax=Neisseria iguanae TaxID=90242 RepID=A0A2P7U351_9NEIS|nr:hypothetical protein C7N83_00935 [Neisseria iguanae]
MNTRGKSDTLYPTSANFTLNLNDFLIFLSKCRIQESDLPNVAIIIISYKTRYNRVQIIMQTEHTKKHAENQRVFVQTALLSNKAV